MIIVDRQVCWFHLRPFHACLYLSVTVYSRFIRRCPVMYRMRGRGLRLVSAEVFRRTIRQNNPGWVCSGVYSVRLNPSINARYSASENLATWAKRLNKASQCLYSLPSLGLRQQCIVGKAEPRLRSGMCLLFVSECMNRLPVIRTLFNCT